MASDAQIWRRRAEQARRLARSLQPADAVLVDLYAQECEYRGRCLSDPLGRRRCDSCPLVHGEPCGRSQ